MRKRVAFLTFASIVVLAFANGAVAQFNLPSTTDHYAFLPRASVFHRIGGFIGTPIEYRVFGTFDFKIEQSPLAIFPPTHFANFIDPRVVASGNLNSIVDVDRVLNLAGITGKEAHYPSPNAFRFEGTTSDGSSVKLEALLRGQWFYLRGGTTRPAGSADFFEYDIRALARKTPVADVNDDGVVDAQDLATWSHSPNTTGGAANFLAWQEQLGEAAPTTDQLDAELNAALTGAATSIPEPGTLGLAAMAVIALAAKHQGARAGAARLRFW